MPTFWLSSTSWNSSTAEWFPTASGVTIYDVVFSVDRNNMPVTGATFETMVFINGVESDIELNTTPINANTGSFVAYFSASVSNIYQFSIYNITTGVRYVSDVFRLTVTSTESFVVYIEPPASS